MSIEIGDDYLDSRDIEEKIDELSQDIEDYMEENELDTLDHQDPPEDIAVHRRRIGRNGKD